MKRAFLALVLLVAACEGRVDPQLVDNEATPKAKPGEVCYAAGDMTAPPDMRGKCGPDVGRVERISQGIVVPPPSYTQAKVDFWVQNYTPQHEYDNWVVLRSPGNEKLMDYIMPQNGSGLNVGWQYWMQGLGAWVPMTNTPGFTDSIATRTGGTLITIPTEGKICWPLGCLAVQQTIQYQSSWHHEKQLQTNWLPPGWTPGQPHPDVWVRRVYQHVCRNGQIATAPIWADWGFDLTQAPATVNMSVGPLANEIANGLFQDPTAWGIIAHQCGDYPDPASGWDPFGPGGYYVHCQCGSVGDTYGVGGTPRSSNAACFFWPGAGTCTPSDSDMAQCKQRCGG